MSRLSIRDIQKMKDEGRRISVVTAYDAMSARTAEAADIPMILVGDSLGMVVQGHGSTIPVTLDHMMYHCEIVVRVTQKPLIVGDLPFMTYSISAEQAMQSAARLIQASQVTAVKVEGGRMIAPTIQRLVAAGMPVMGHIGLTPQSVNQFGGFRVQGRGLDEARRLLDDALAVQDAGAFAIVLELVPTRLAALITQRLHIPTIGIGAGVHCDGQVQVFHDILALDAEFLPRHARRFATLGEAMQAALREYRQSVEDASFPTDENGFSMSEDVLRQLQQDGDDAGHSND